MNEEVVVRMGLDQRPIAAGLRSVTSRVREWASEAKKSFAEGLRPLAAPITAAGLIEGVRRLGETVERIKATSEAAGVSTNFLQDLENVGKAAGLAGERVDEMLQKFVQGLPVGSDVETEFYKLSDRLAGIEDPAERARAAVQAFGRAGLDMLKIAGQGSGKIKDLASQFAKLGDADIRAIEQANESIQRFESNFNVVVGKAIRWSSMTVEALYTSFRTGAGMGDLGKLFANETLNQDAEAKSQRLLQAQYAAAKAANDARFALEKYNKHLDELTLKSGTAEEKMAVLNQQFSEAAKAVNHATNGQDYFAALSKAADIAQDIKDLEAKTQQDKLQALDKQNEKLEHQREVVERITDLRSQRSDAVDDLATAQGDRNRFTLEQLSTLGIDRNTTPEMARQIIDARRVRGGELQARQLAAHGHFKEANDLMGQVDKVRSGLSALTDHDRFPFQSMVKGIDRMDKNIDELVRKAAAEGINIIPKNGD